MHNLELLWTHTMSKPFIAYIVAGDDSALSEEERGLADAYIEEYEIGAHIVQVSNTASLEECKLSEETETCYTLAIYSDNTDHGYHGLYFDI